MHEDALEMLRRSDTTVIVATVDAHGEPTATRGWGLRVAGPDEVVVLLDASDDVTLENVAAGSRIAITLADVETLHSVQVKGTTCGTVAELCEEEVAEAERFVDQVFDAIGRVDRTPRAVLERWVPLRLVACPVRIDAMFDQTPGPKAGATL